MADGTPQGGAAIVAADEISTDNGVVVSLRQAQRVKIDARGIDGSFTDVSNTNPLPVSAFDANAYDQEFLILTELRVISTLLQIGLGIKDDPSDLRNDYLTQFNY